MFEMIYNLFEFNSLLIVLFVAIILIYLTIYLKNKRFNELLTKIPGPPPGYLMVGNLNMIWFNNCHKLVNALNQVYEGLSVIYADQGIFKFKGGPLDIVAIYRNDLVQDFLKNNSNLEKPFEYQILYDWLGKGLLINDNSALWKHRRKLLTPAFHFKIIEDFIPVINEKANVLVEKLNDFVGEKSFNLEPLLFSCTLDAIAETTLGVQLNSQQNKNKDYFEAVHRMTKNFFKRLAKPWLFYDCIFYMTETGREYKSDLKILHGLTRKVINERKDSLLIERQNTDSEIIDKKKKRLAFLDLLLDLHLKDNSLSLEDIREEVDTFMFAGHDTGACCLIWTFYLLGLHPDIQQRVQEELDSIVGNNEEITMDDIKQFTYLDAVIKESMRIYPPVPIIARKVSEDLKLGEYIVPKGVSLYLMISRLHMDPNIFPEPLLFNPDRFVGDYLSKNENSFCFTPFSAGARNCIGQKFAINEIKVIIAKVLLNYSLRSLEDRNDIIVFNGIILKPLNGIQMKVEPRSF